jgi:hypothetical protein
VVTSRWFHSGFGILRRGYEVHIANCINWNLLIELDAAWTTNFYSCIFSMLHFVMSRLIIIASSLLLPEQFSQSSNRLEWSPVSDFILASASWDVDTRWAAREELLLFQMTWKLLSMYIQLWEISVERHHSFLFLDYNRSQTVTDEFHLSTALFYPSVFLFIVMMTTALLKRYDPSLV